MIKKWIGKIFFVSFVESFKNRAKFMTLDQNIPLITLLRVIFGKRCCILGQELVVLSRRCFSLPKRLRNLVAVVTAVSAMFEPSIYDTYNRFGL